MFSPLETNLNHNSNMIPELQVSISGYAASGGGRGIERVDVSVDGGKTWMEASRFQKSDIPYTADDDGNCEKWAWVLFEVTAEIQQSTEIIAKAVYDVSSAKFHVSNILSLVQIMAEKTVSRFSLNISVRNTI